MSNDKLEKLQAISSIISSIAIPFILLIVGYFIQKQLSDAGLKKDYVAIATGILKDSPNGQDPELRKWAVSVLDENAPIPFSKKAKENLKNNSIYVALPSPVPATPSDACMTPPAKGLILPFVKKLNTEKYKSFEEVSKRFNEFKQFAVDSEFLAELDRANLKCMQRYGDYVKGYVAQVEKMNTNLESK